LVPYQSSLKINMDRQNKFVLQAQQMRPAAKRITVRFTGPAAGLVVSPSSFCHRLAHAYTMTACVWIFLPEDTGSLVVWSTILPVCICVTTAVSQRERERERVNAQLSPNESRVAICEPAEHGQVRTRRDDPNARSRLTINRVSVPSPAGQPNPSRATAPASPVSQRTQPYHLNQRLVGLEYSSPGRSTNDQPVVSIFLNRRSINIGCVMQTPTA
jgi:hypothetical protein